MSTSSTSTATPPVKDDDFRHRYYNAGHNNAAGYLYSSWIMMTYIDWIVRQDDLEFAEVALIGKNKTLYPKDPDQ